MPCNVINAIIRPYDFLDPHPETLPRHRFRANHPIPWPARYNRIIPRYGRVINLSSAGDSRKHRKKGLPTNDAVITAPQQAIAERKARTQQLRQRFNVVESQFQVLDRLIEFFRATPQGRDMIAAWQASRVIRDLGHRPSSPSPAESPTSEGS